MLIKTRREGDKLVLILPKEFDFKVHRGVRDAYKDEPSDLIFEIDMRNVEHIDSSALGMLMLIYEHANNKVENLRMVNLSGAVRELLNIARFDRYFTFS